jgi:hypothetical protein
VDVSSPSGESTFAIADRNRRLQAKSSKAASGRRKRPSVLHAKTRAERGESSHIENDRSSVVVTVQRPPTPSSRDRCLEARKAPVRECGWSTGIARVNGVVGRSPPFSRVSSDYGRRRASARPLRHSKGRWTSRRSESTDSTPRARASEKNETIRFRVPNPVIRRGSRARRDPHRRAPRDPRAGPDGSRRRPGTA